MKTALLLIDVQESFRHRPTWDARDVPAFLHACNTLVQGCQARGVPIVRIFHLGGDDMAANPFAKASGHVRPLDGLDAFEPAFTVEKRRHSALVGTGLADWLREHGIARVLYSSLASAPSSAAKPRHATPATKAGRSTTSPKQR